MDGGAWWATAQSQRRLWQLSTHAEDSRGSLFPAHLCIKNVILFFSSFTLFTMTTHQSSVSFGARL